MRYLSMVLVICTIVSLVGCGGGDGGTPVPDMLHRTADDMKYFEELLRNVKSGDLIVMTSADGEHAPEMHKVVRSVTDGFMTVSIPAETTHKQVVVAIPVVEYSDWYKSHGGVHFIPQKRADVFYLQVGSAAFMNAVR